MAEGYTVSVVYKNRQFNTIGEKQYTLDSYCAHAKDTILSSIQDVENLIYAAEGGKAKNEWSRENQ